MTGPIEQCPDCRVKYDNEHVCKMPCCGYIENDLGQPCEGMVNGTHICPKCQKYIHAFHGYDINNSIKYITCAKCHEQTEPVEINSNLTTNIDQIQSQKTNRLYNLNSINALQSRERPIPVNCQARLEIIIGPELGTQRKRAGQPIIYLFSLEDGYEVFLAKTKNAFNQNIKKDELDLKFNGKKVYVKKSVKQKMTDLTALTEDNFIIAMKHAWKNQHSWKKSKCDEIALSTPNFFFPIFIFNPIKKTNSIHRATQERIEQVSKLLQEQVQASGNEELGPATLRYAATINARQPTNVPVVVPNDFTINQLANIIDRLQAELNANDNSAESTRELDIFIGG